MIYEQLSTNSRWWQLEMWDMYETEDDGRSQDESPQVQPNRGGSNLQDNNNQDPDKSKDSKTENEDQEGEARFWSLKQLEDGGLHKVSTQ